MQRSLSAEDARFQAELREFMTTQFPEEIRAKVRAGAPLTKDELVRSQQILNAAGYAVPHWPTEWGGRDWTPLQFHIWQSEMQAAAVPMPLPFNASMVGPVIATFGSEELKQRFLPATANLDIWWGQGFSEPDAGSDLASLRTTAVRDGDEYVVNGQKTWTTLGQHADWIFCLSAPTPTPRSRRASPSSSSTGTARVSRSGPSSSSTAGTRSTRCSSPTSVSRRRTSSARRTRAGPVRRGDGDSEATQGQLF